LIWLSGCTSEEKVPPLSVVGITGDLYEFSLKSITNLPSVSGQSSYENSFGNIGGSGEYKGVKISSIAEEVGGIQQGDLLRVISTDGYSQIFTYDNIHPPSVEANSSQGTMILAYEFNGKMVPEWEDGYLIAFLPPDNTYSTEDHQSTTSLEYSDKAASTRWVKWVTKMEFIREEETVLFVGEKNHSLSYSQLEQLPSVSGSGSYLKTTGEVVGPFNFKGVDIISTLNLMINTTVDFSIETIASDGYKFKFTKSQTYGNVSLFDQNGEEIGHGGPENTTLTLVYSEDGEPLSAGNGGPFRMVYLGENSPITEGHFWVMFVDTIIIGRGVLDWTITLSGLTEFEVGLDDFDSIVYCGDQVHNASYQYTDGENEITYEGMPLWVALSIIDGGESGDGHYVFNDTLASQGYTVTIFSKDGTNLTLSSSVTTRNDSLILAHVKNGQILPSEEFPVRLVSKDLPQSQWISRITVITITDI
jgi:DMSO/TMAO reductase YedYZ molybdopterin-dependent catalytic subunit